MDGEPGRARGNGAANAPGIPLAHRPDFRLGAALVRPSLRTVEGPEGAAPAEPRVMQVLLALVDADGAVLTREDLMRICWPGTVVGDDSVNRAIAEVRRIAQASQAGFSVETIPRVGYRLTIAARQVEDPEPQDTLKAGVLSRPGLGRILAIAGLALAVAALLLWGPTFRSTPANNGRVEVQPFRPLQRDANLDRLSAAYTDAAVRMLTGTGVAAVEPASPAVKGSAEFRLVGTVDRAGANYVVNAEIRDRKSGLVLWSGRIVRPEEEAFADDELAGRVAGFVRCALKDRKAARRTLKPEIFGMLLNACDAALLRDHARMLDVTRRLVELAPDLAPGQAMYALAQAGLAQRPQQSEAQREALNAGARRAAEAALRLDPKLAKAHLARGMSQGGARKNWQERERNFLKALELEPDLLPARASYNNLLRQVGRTSEATEMDLRLAETDPRATGSLANVAVDTAARGDLPQAYRMLDRLTSSEPARARAARAQIAVWWDTPQAGRQVFRELEKIHSPTEVACFEAYLGRRNLRPTGLPDACATAPIDWRIRMLAREGDVEGALRLLRSLPPRTNVSFLYYPELAPVRADPRFIAVAERLGLGSYWRSTGRWPDFCSDPRLLYDCKRAFPAATPHRG